MLAKKMEDENKMTGFEFCKEFSKIFCSEINFSGNLIRSLDSSQFFCTSRKDGRSILDELTSNSDIARRKKWRNSSESRLPEKSNVPVPINIPKKDVMRICLIALLKLAVD